MSGKLLRAADAKPGPALLKGSQESREFFCPGIVEVCTGHVQVGRTPKCDSGRRWGGEGKGDFRREAARRVLT